MACNISQTECKKKKKEDILNTNYETMKNLEGMPEIFSYKIFFSLSKFFSSGFQESSDTENNLGGKL